MMHWYITFLSVVCFGLFVSQICAAFNLTVLHTNDVHSHFAQFNVFGGRCPDHDVEAGKCFGGFARQVTKVKEIRERSSNVLFLNGGDFFQGTVFYTFYKWKILSEFVNKLTIDAMSLGNHEFDDDLKGLFPYLEASTPTIVVCNIDSSKVPAFGELVKRSVVLEVGGEKIGVIGYVTPETKFLSSTGALEFTDEVECIAQEAKRLSEEGINKIIAVGHSGIVKDSEIAANVPEVDIVVGGHTNTFLYSGEPPSVEEPSGPYPTVFEHEDGSRALVVQDFAFAKYMGYLEVQFGDNGEVIGWNGNPILLDNTVQQDAEILQMLKPYEEEVKVRGQLPVGRTNVLLRADRPICRMRECNMGNFLADASLDYFVEDPTETGWNSVGIAVWNSGGIRASIDERINKGNITFEDIMAIAPFGNTMDVVALQGKHLKEVLEYSVREYDVDGLDPPGTLLQVSGMKVTFNISQPAGSRVHDVRVRCTNCRVPRYLPLNDTEVYEVVMNTYMAKGGDGFSVIPENAISNRNTDELDVDIIIRYMKKCSPIITGLEDRIVILSSACTECHSKYNSSADHGDKKAESDSEIRNGSKGPEKRIGVPVKEMGEEFKSANGVLGSRGGENTENIPEKTREETGNVFGSRDSESNTGVQDVGGRVGTGLQDTGSRVGTGVQDTGSRVVTGVQDTGVVTGLQDTGGRVGTGLQDTGSRVVTGLQDTGSRVVTGVQDIGGRVGTGLQNVGGRITGGLQEVGKGALNLAEKVPGGLQKLNPFGGSKENDAEQPKSSSHGGLGSILGG